MADYDTTLQALLKAQKREPTIIRLGEPLSQNSREHHGERVSDVSADALESSTPASLEAELIHYKVWRT